MLGAPILAGMLVAPSWPGLWLALAGVCAFLCRQPLRLALTDLTKGKRYPRTAWALRFAGGYGLLGMTCLAACFLTAASFKELLAPILFGGILGAFQFSQDLAGKGRRFLPEVCGAAALSTLAVAISLLGGLEPVRAWTVGAVMALQFIAAISYASARVRLARNAEVSRIPAYVLHVTALAAVGAFCFAGILRWPIVAVFAILALRATWGLSCHRRPVRAAMVGVQEVFYTILTVAALALAI